MSVLNGPLNFLQDAIVSFLGIDLPAIKATVIEAGGTETWAVLTHLSDPRILLLGILPCLILERLFPAADYKAHKGGNLLLDFLYPIPQIFIPTAIVGSGAFLAKYISVTYLPFLNTGLLDGKPLWVQALGAFLIVDFMFYWSHRMRHEVRWFWHFHAIHHSQKLLNPATTYRGHVGEKTISGLIITIPIAIVGGSYPAWLLFIVLNNFWGHFIHSNVRFNLGWLGKFIVSPQYHRVHHSILTEHFDVNYGERLTIWDKLFGTYHPDRESYPPTGIPYSNWIDERSNNPLKIPVYYALQFSYPFVRIGESIYSFVRSLYQRIVSDASAQTAQKEELHGR